MGAPTHINHQEHLMAKMPANLLSRFKGKETAKEEKSEKKMPPALYKKGEKMEEAKMKKAGKPVMKGKY
jgi:hypothetical protein